MKVILLQNTIHNGTRYKAGETVDLADDVSDKWIEAKLACAIEAKKPVTQSKPKAKRGAKK